MLWKVLNGFSQAVIIVLALVLITTITTKHSSNVALEDFQKQVDERFQADNLVYNNKIKTLEDNLNRYQQLREQRAVLYSKRLDELYDLYKKDPTPIDSSKAVKIEDYSKPQTEPSIDKNFNFLEQKINKVDEKADTNNSKTEQRLNILEQRVNLLNANKASNVKVVQTNLNNQVVNNGKIE